MRVTASKVRGPLASVLAGAMYAAAGEANAGGFGVNEISVEGLGRANSGEAADTGAMLWWNPASIARSPREISLGVHRRDHSVDFTDNGSTITYPVPPAGLTVPVGGLSNVSDGSDGDPPRPTSPAPCRSATGSPLVCRSPSCSD